MTEYFLRPYLVFLLVLVLPIVFAWAHRQITIRHPSLKPHKGLAKSSWITITASICLAMMVVNLNIALMGPKLPNATVQHVAVIRKVCIFVDRSGSMTAVLKEGAKELKEDEAKAKSDPNAVVDNATTDADKLKVQEGTESEKPEGEMTRMDAAQLAARYIIRNRMTDNLKETDHFCLMTFDTDTYMMAPLSNDKKVLLLRTVHITENTGGGTNFAGPYGYVSGIGPLQKAVDYFSTNTSTNSVSVAILITDGEDGFPEDRAKQLQELFKQHRLRLYVVGLGDSWKEGNTLDLQKFADTIHQADPTNGIVFRASNPGEMKKAMQTINALEKAQEVVEERQEYREIYHWFLLFAAGFGAIFVLLALGARRVP